MSADDRELAEAAAPTREHRGSSETGARGALAGLSTHESPAEPARAEEFLSRKARRQLSTHESPAEPAHDQERFAQRPLVGRSMYESPAERAQAEQRFSRSALALPSTHESPKEPARAQKLLVRRALARLSTHVSHAEPAHAELLLVRGAVAGLLGAVAGLVPAAFLERALAAPTALGLTAALLFLLLPRQAPSLLVLLWGATALVALLSPTPARFVPFYFTAALGLVLAFEHEGWFHRGVALMGPTLGGLWGLQVVAWLSARYLGPAAYLGAAATVALGLFVAAGAAAAGLEWSADGVTPRLREDPKVQRSWERLRLALSRLPEPAVQRQLQALARASVERWLAARAETAAVVASLDDELEARSKEALLQLDARLETTKDAGVADSLRHLARVHRDTLEQFDGLRRRRERLEATAASEAAWLETAAFTVELAPRTEWARSEMASRLEALSSARA